MKLAAIQTSAKAYQFVQKDELFLGNIQPIYSAPEAAMPALGKPLNKYDNIGTNAALQLNTA
ncbi:MAG: hypothetical protein JKY88_01140 [Pseudomonadales bacterium]|nr:hypothetical protein [Pseudomonadales bacterium]